ncbi:glycosyltransferase family 2 protein [Desulfovulcanus ferrireducens]|uniref:glycosyltransferase family 2 protein n=1 Tax=Desulfovulcanus ferrireducens TaxID=2831190 RepID=UPI00207BB7E6|nr:glycosyltransferase family 2 protein [Desulfovulcanus ferrireducens]
MLISVIIPTFNRGQYIVDAVNSVLNQTWKKLELIVVDDGSNDQTRALLEKIKDKRFHYFYQENKGVSSARNFGLKKARGDFLALLDSDDYWLPEKLSVQLKFMLEGGFHISQTQEIWIRRGKRVNPMSKHTQPGGWFFEKSLHLCLISPSCVLFSRKVVEEVGFFDERLTACEDYDLWLRTQLKFPVALVPYPLVIRRGGHCDQLSRKIIGLDLYRIYSLLKLRTFPMSKDKKEALKRVLEKKVSIYISGCLKRGKFEEAERIKELWTENRQLLF